MCRFGARRIVLAGFAAWVVVTAARSVEAPVLRIETAPDRSIRLSWPSSSEGYMLEEASDLAGPGVWKLSSALGTLQGDRFEARIDGGPSTRFFRLRWVGDGLPTRVTETSPAPGESGVSVTRPVILNFSAPLAADATLSTDLFYAEAGGRKRLSRVELASDRTKATLFFLEDLAASSRVVVTLHGDQIRDSNGKLVDGDGDGVPGGAYRLVFDTLSITPVSQTAVVGHVYASELVPVTGGAGGFTNRPLGNVTITVDGAEETLRTTTDAQGYFKLSPAPAGRFFVHVDGRTAVGSAWPQGDYYPFVGKAWEAAAGRDDNLAGGSGEIFLPLIRSGTLQAVSSTETTAVTFPPEVLAANPALEGVTVNVPANSLYGDNGVRGGKVGIAPVAPDRLPEPLPAGLNLPLVITIQTDGPLNFDEPVPVRFPNVADPKTGKKLPPGSKSALWSFNHRTGKWEVVGPMTVSADGNYVETDPGVGVRQPGWHGTQPGTSGNGGPLNNNPPPCKDGDPSNCRPKAGWDPSEHYNGCGPDGGDYLVPDNPNLNCASFYDACKAHDIGYSTCGKPKDQTDEQFLQGMRAACDCLLPFDPVAYAKCMALAQAYYLAVSKGGGGAYDDAQRDACDCSCPAPGAGSLFAQQPGGRQRVTILGRQMASTAPNDTGGTPALGLHYYAIYDLDARSVVQRGITGANGIAFDNLILSPNTHYQVSVLQASTLNEGYVEFLTPGSGQRFTVPPIYLKDPTSYDFDGDGLHDRGEFVMGTDPQNPDSDGDGVLDSAEVLQGTDPLNGIQVRTGVIARVATTGAALDIVARNNMAVVAESEAGVSVFDVSSGLNPVLLSRVITEGKAVGVALSGNYAASANKQGGLALLDMGNPAAARLLSQVNLGGVVNAVALAAGVAHAGLESGSVVSVDVATGAVLERFQLTGSPRIQDMQVSGRVLFVLGVDRLYAVALDEGEMRILSSVCSPGSVGAALRRLRLFVGGGKAYCTHTEGYNVIDVSDPENLRSLQVNNTAQRGWKQIVPNGSGLAIATVDANSTDDGLHDVSTYVIGTDGLGTQYQTTFPTPGIATAVSLYNGMAFVADGAAGLEIMNYLAFDTLGVPPAIVLSASIPLDPAVAEEGKVVTVTAHVTDDVQVRNVEFYLDGELAAIDGNFPFELDFVTPLRAPTKDRFRLRVKVSDTGGNFTWSDEVTIQLVPDATPPRVLRKYPASGSIVGAAEYVSAQFSEPVRPATLTTASFQLRFAGTDNVLGNADDRAILTGSFEYQSDLNLARYNLSEALAPGLYQVTVQSPIADLVGNAILSPTIWTFWVTGGVDSDGDGVPDAVEVALGLDPHNPDTNGNGTLDGDEDPDGDRLPTRWELAFGFNPTLKDSDANGVSDDLEDTDSDGLNNHREFLARTNPTNGDSDGDGWDDNGEVLEGTDPSSAASQPRMLLVTTSVSFLNAVAENVPPSTQMIVASLPTSYLNAVAEGLPAGTTQLTFSTPVSYLNALAEPLPPGTEIEWISLPVSYLNSFPEQYGGTVDSFSPLVSYQNE